MAHWAVVTLSRVGQFHFATGGGASHPTFKGEGGCFYKGGGQVLRWDGMVNLALSICFSILHIIGSKTARFQGISGIAIAQNTPPRPQNGLKTLVRASKWSRNNFGKHDFFSPQGPWWTHRWPPPCAGRAALQLHQVTTGTGV